MHRRLVEAGKSPVGKNMESIDRHLSEILQNQRAWEKKRTLRRIYRRFHERIASSLPPAVEGQIIEIGSGVADITQTIPGCIRTDLFPNPWIDQVENAYALSFEDRSGSAIILFDVFHHLRYPGTALREFWRVLAPGGRVIIFDPGISLLGRLGYGSFHPEPLGFHDPITWSAPTEWSPDDLDYYAAQANAHRIFVQHEVDLGAEAWRRVAVRRYADLSYVASGGYSRTQLYPDFLLPVLFGIDAAASLLPGIFATRQLVVLEKQDQD